MRVPPGLEGLRLAVTMFTVIPLPGTSAETPAGADRTAAAAAVPWLPVIGALLGLGGTLIAWLVPAPLLAAVMIVVLWAAATGGLHLDGLADTADGLGSRRPAPEALKIMKRSDIGPFGVAALVLTLLVQVAALASIAEPLTVAVAPMTGRVAVVLACGAPSARPGGFGDLVAGALSPVARYAIAGASFAAGTACAFAVGSVTPVIAMIGGGAAALLLLRIAVRRLGGTTGDVFGALIELATATTLAITALW